MKTKKDECSYSFSNAIRTLVMVRATGLEPAQEVPLEPKSNASANSATPAFSKCLNYLYCTIICDLVSILLLYFVFELKKYSRF